MELNLTSSLANLKAMPIGADLVLREKPDPEAILQEGKRLAAVLLEAAARFETPLVVPIMNLGLEKHALCSLLGVTPQAEDRFHLETPLAEGEGEALVEAFDPMNFPEMRANIEALAEVRRHPDVIPMGMSIGPFSLMVKLLADPITTVYLAGMGVSETEEPTVKLLHQVLALSTGIIKKYMLAQLAAGAQIFFIAEPAANKVYLSPKQLESGTDVFERFVMRNLRELNALLHAQGAALFFHCCGELVPSMLAAFASLKPEILSLGSSRLLWEDAASVGKETILYGNLPSKKFYSDQEITEEEVYQKARELLEKMAATGHPFILGTECDVLSVKGAEATILRKVEAMLQAARDFSREKELSAL